MENKKEDDIDMKISKKDNKKKNWLEVSPVDTDKSKIKIRETMKQHIIAPHCNRVILNGASNSGKTVLLLNLLTEKRFYCNYYDVVFVFSLTANKLDDSYKYIEKKNNKSKIFFINELSAEKIEQVLKINSDIIEERGSHRAPRMLVIFDDCICDREFMRSNAMERAFVMGRHSGASIWMCTQRFSSVPRVCRLQASQIYLFKCTGSEIKTLNDEFCPSGYKKREFEALIHHATKDDYSFLSINMTAPRQERFRKNLDQILRLKR